MSRDINSSFGLRTQVRFQTVIQHTLPKVVVVVWLAWSNDAESYATGNIVTDRVCHAREVKGDD
jgi:hypothetical protein